MVTGIRPASVVARMKITFVNNVSNIIDAVVGSGVDFNDIHGSSVCDIPADTALTAGVPVFGVFTVDRPRQDLGRGCLSGAPCPRKEVGVLKTIRYDLIAQGTYDRILTFDLIENPGPCLAIESDIGHKELISKADSHKFRQLDRLIVRIDHLELSG